MGNAVLRPRGRGDRPQISAIEDSTQFDRTDELEAFPWSVARPSRSCRLLGSSHGRAFRPFGMAAARYRHAWGTSRPMQRRKITAAIALAVSSYGCRPDPPASATRPRMHPRRTVGLMSSRREATAAPRAAAALSAQGMVLNSPLPQGSDLVSVWASSPTDIWAVGRDGATLHWDGTSFKVLTEERFGLRKGVGVERRGGFSLPEPGTNIASSRHDGGSWAESLRATIQAPSSSPTWGTGGDVWVVGSATSPTNTERGRAASPSGGSTWGRYRRALGRGAGPPMPGSRFAEPGPNDVWASSGNRLAHWRGSWVSGSCGETFGTGSCNSQIGLIAEGRDRHRSSGSWVRTGTSPFAAAQRQLGPCRHAALCGWSRGGRGHELRGLGDGPDPARDRRCAFAAPSCPRR